MKIIDYIPFIGSDSSCAMATDVYRDAAFARISLERADRLCQRLPSTMKLWLDPAVDGLDDLRTRRSEPGKSNQWFDYMGQFPGFEQIGSSAFQAAPSKAAIEGFVEELLGACLKHKPQWITVPQLPVCDGSERNRVNRVLASATGRWKSRSSFAGRLILPLIFTNQRQTTGRTARKPKVDQAERCYHDAGADGYWVADKNLSDESGSVNLRRKRFVGIIAFHEELDQRVPSRIRIAGPYWGLNLVLWAKKLVDYPAIGVGSGYQLFLAGGHARNPEAKLALPALRRRAVASAQLRNWLDQVLKQITPAHPAYTELSDLKRNFALLSAPERAREQVARFYKKWVDLIAAAPVAGRPMALFQDLSTAYAFGKSFPNLEGEGAARRPEAVAEPLMLSSL